MDNLGVRLPVDATTKSKFKAKGLTSQMKEEIPVDSRKVHRENCRVLVADNYSGVIT